MEFFNTMNMTVDFENCFKFEGNGKSVNITKYGIEVFVVWNNNDSPEKKKNLISIRCQMIINIYVY